MGFARLRFRVRNIIIIEYLSNSPIISLPQILEHYRLSVELLTVWCIFLFSFSLRRGCTRVWSFTWITNSKNIRKFQRTPGPPPPPLHLPPSLCYSCPRVLKRWVGLLRGWGRCFSSDFADILVEIFSLLLMGG